MSRRTGLALACFVTLVVVGLLVTTREGPRDPQTGPVEPPAAAEREVVEPLMAPAAARAALAPEPRTEPVPSPDSIPQPAPASESYLFHARVVADATGAPLADAALFTIDDGQPASEPRARSGPDGFVALEVGPPYPNPLLRVEHAGHAWTVVRARRGHEHPADAQVVRLVRTAGLRAEVLRFGAPARELVVSVSTPAFRMRQPGALFFFDPPTDPTWSATTDAAGIALLDDLPPRVPLTVDVLEEGVLVQRVALPVELDPGVVLELVIPLGSGCTVRGVAVEPDGTLVEGLGIWLREATEPRDGKYFRDHDRERVVQNVQTDGHGAFAFEDVGVGDWWVGLAPQGTSRGLIAPLARLVSVAEGDLWKDVRLEVHHGLYLGGRVVGPGGESADGVSVSVVGTGLGGSAYEGKFRIGPLGPGEYTLFAYAGSNRALSSSANVVAAAGTEDLVLELRGAAALAGECVGADGATAPATVTLVPVDRQAARFWSRPAGFREDGRFEVTRLVPGLYHVLATDELGNVGVLANVEARAGETADGLRVELTPGAIVIVSVAEPRDGLFPILLQHGLELHVGAGRVNVPPGPVTVELRRLDPTTNTLVTIDARDAVAFAGEEVEVVFEIASGR